MDTRGYDRSPVELQVTVTTADGTSLQGRTGDVGMGGFSLKCDQPSGVGTWCHLVLDMGEGEHAVHIETEGQVVWTADGIMGVAFMDTDPENYKKIRDLFLYNPVGAGWE